MFWLSTWLKNQHQMNTILMPKFTGESKLNHHHTTFLHHLNWTYFKSAEQYGVHTTNQWWLLDDNFVFGFHCLSMWLTTSLGVGVVELQWNQTIWVCTTNLNSTFMNISICWVIGSKWKPISTSEIGIQEICKDFQEMYQSLQKF